MKSVMLVFSSLLLAGLCTTTAMAAEHSVPCKTLPAAVQTKSKDVVGTGTVHNCVKDVSGGKTTYEMETMLDGRSKDITFDSDGTVLEIEQQVDAGSLPASVASAFHRAAEGGSLGKIESLTRGDKIVSYEGVVTRNGKRSEIAFHPDGASMKAD